MAVDYILYRKTFFYKEVQIVKFDGSIPADIAAWTFAMKIKATKEATTDLTTLANTASTTATGIRLLLPTTNAKVAIQVSIADSEALPSAEALSYDLIGTESAGLESFEQEGEIESKTTGTLG